MSAATMGDEAAAAFTALQGIPKVDFPTNLQAAIAAGRRMTSILAEVVALRRGPSKLSPNEYFYFRLWEPHLTRDDQGRFVGQAGAAADAHRLQQHGLVRHRRRQAAVPYSDGGGRPASPATAGRDGPSA